MPRHQLSSLKQPERTTMNAHRLKLAGLGATAAAAISTATLPAVADAATTEKYTAYTRFSDVKVAITVTGKKITSIAYTANPQDGRSYQLEAYALPLLRKRALSAQTYRIHTVSGVTVTSQAFLSSLYSAMQHAHLV
jgi:uncharacterized protein with FMN-binding domain